MLANRVAPTGGNEAECLNPLDKALSQKVLVEGNRKCENRNKLASYRSA